MIRSIAFFAYPVADMGRSRAFYEGVLGLKPGHVLPGRWIEYDVAGVAFGIGAGAPPEMARPGARGGNVAFEVDDVDAFAVKVLAAGVPIVKEPFDTPVCRMAMIADPDGNLITLHRCKHP